MNGQEAGGKAEGMNELINLCRRSLCPHPDRRGIKNF